VEVKKIFKELFIVPRTLASPNNRKSLKIIKKYLPIKIKSIKSGSKVFDWKVPNEWIFRDAWIKNHEGKKVLNFKNSILNIINYSHRINKKVFFKDLKKNIFLFKGNDKNAIPYRTSYYKKEWGFCLSQNQYKLLKKNKKKLKVYIESFQKSGRLNYGELLIKGRSSKEILISCYICHPSQANDSLSGVVMAIKLSNYLLFRKNNFSYRIIFISETIGSITYIYKNLKIGTKIFCGFILTNCAGKGQLSFKQSFIKDHIINDFLRNIFYKIKKKIYKFSIRGSDERQFSSYPWRLNCISIFRAKYFTYKYYHTSKDNLQFISIKNFNEVFNYYLKLIKKIEKLKFFERVEKNCELMMSKYNLYHKVGGSYLPKKKNAFDKIMECLFYMDGKLSTLEISKKIKLNLKKTEEIFKILQNKKLVKKI
jgi:aminopeptidase-like protein